jgi:4-hydroxy-3-polyprenylbenzoate decarboxylase
MAFAGVSLPACTNSRSFKSSCEFIVSAVKEFYHRRPGAPQLDLPQIGCETEFTRGDNMRENGKKIITVGVTGASGAVLAQKMLALLDSDSRVERVHLVVTETGLRLFAEELMIPAGSSNQLVQRLLGRSSQKIELLANKDVGAAIASGSYKVDAMAVIPCSVGSLAKIAAGTCDDLLARSADVMLKEGRKLVLCVRDTPFSRIHLENMLLAQQAGAVIMPAIPSYYHVPKTIDDLVTQYVCRVLAQMDLQQEAMFRWTGSAAAKEAKA